MAADGTNKKGDLVALRRDFESFITKLKQSDHWNAEFDAQFLAALRSTNAKNGVQQIGGARRLLEAVVGVAPDGANAWEFLARSDQDGMTITHYGYLTHISDLPDESLFSNPGIRTEVTARFTFSATTKLTARHLLGNIIATAAMGRLTIYFNQAPGADFTIPASFANVHRHLLRALPKHSQCSVSRLRREHSGCRFNAASSSFVHIGWTQSSLGTTCAAGTSLCHRSGHTDAG